MKEAFGGISIFQIVVAFIILFAGIMCLTINHSIAFAVKDEVITIIQENGTIDDTTITNIIEHLDNAGYRITGPCPNDYTGYDRRGQQNNNAASFCVRKKSLRDAMYNDLIARCNNKCNIAYEDDLDMTYYDIVLFYQLDIPVLNSIMNFKLYGTTRVLFE